MKLSLDTVFWILQIIVSIKLITVSYSHGLNQSKPEMREAIQKVGNFSRPILFVVAASSLIGTTGLLLPGWLALPVWATPLVASIVSAMMIASIIFHKKGREKPMIFVSLILALLSAVIAYGRWVIAPL